MGEYERKRSLGRRRQVCKYTLEMTFKEMGREFVCWIHLAQDSVKRRAVMYSVMNLWNL